MTQSSKKEKNLLTLYYKTLSNKQKRDLNKEIAASCFVKRDTVLKWMNGLRTPLRVYRVKIADVIGLPEDKLFKS